MGLLRLLLAFSVVLEHSHSFYGFSGMGASAVPAFYYFRVLHEPDFTTKYKGFRQACLLAAGTDFSGRGKSLMKFDSNLKVYDLAGNKVGHIR